MGRGEEHGQRQKWIEQVQLLASYAYKWRKQERERQILDIRHAVRRPSDAAGSRTITGE